MKKLLWIVMAGLLLSACATHHPPRKAADAQLKFHANGGYIAAAATTASAVAETWRVGAAQVDVSLMLPSGTGSYPLVVYLPGQEESSSDGLAWRQAWSSAGYAVVSIQVAGTGLRIPSRAGTDDARDIFRKYYSADAVAARLDMLRGVLEELDRRRNDPRQEGYRHIDLSRVAVAGFDAGALAAMVVAGENIEGMAPQQFPAAIKCVIALSPYADFSGMAVEQLFRSIRLPALSVTSWADTDSYGLVSSATVRRAPFQYMPPGRKYLLLLASAPHALIGGDTRQREENRGREKEAEGNDAASTAGDAGAERSRSDEGGRGRGRGRGGKHSRAAFGQAVATNPMELLIDTQSVTTAFLDATIKQDPMALSWLERDAKRWLGGAVELLEK